MIWRVLVYQPLFSLLWFFWQTTGSLGWAIIGLTLTVRLLLLPLTLKVAKAGVRLNKLVPRLEKLKKKYRHDRQKLAQAQLELYRQAGINPWSSVFFQIFQVIVLLVLFQVFSQALTFKDSGSTWFLYLDLTKPDVFQKGRLIFPGPILLAACLVQVVSSRLSLPQAKEEKQGAKKTTSFGDDFSAALRFYSLYFFPIFTLLIGLRFPAGLVLYWLVFSVFQLPLQWWLTKISKR